jgi:hypothetical protein
LWTLPITAAATKTQVSFIPPTRKRRPSAEGYDLWNITDGNHQRRMPIVFDVFPFFSSGLNASFPVL